MAIGKFQGVTRPTTPSGSERVCTLVPGTTLGSVSPSERQPPAPKKRSTSMARRTSPVASASVLPSSRTRSAAMAACRWRSRSAASISTAPRATGVLAAHPGWAAAAAETAASTSAADEDGAVATTSAGRAGLRRSVPACRSSRRR